MRGTRGPPDTKPVLFPAGFVFPRGVGPRTPPSAARRTALVRLCDIWHLDPDYSLCVEWSPRSPHPPQSPLLAPAWPLDGMWKVGLGVRQRFVATNFRARLPARRWLRCQAAGRWRTAPRESEHDRRVRAVLRVSAASRGDSQHFPAGPHPRGRVDSRAAHDGHRRLVAQGSGLRHGEVRTCQTDSIRGPQDDEHNGAGRHGQRRDREHRTRLGRIRTAGPRRSRARAAPSAGSARGAKASSRNVFTRARPSACDGM